MKLVAVTRILNEDDIVEAFVRHHQPMFDHHLFLDNGSTDRTLEILARLHQEGARLTLLQNTAPFYVEPAYNTNLYGHAARHLAANWVTFLDCDEFVDARRGQEGSAGGGSAGGLRARLAGLPAEIGCLKIATADYFDTAQHGAAGAAPGIDLLVPRRITRRERVPAAPVPRVSVRGSLAAQGATVEGGNHEAYLSGAPIPAVTATDIAIAHFPRRSPWQAMAKAAIGRLKVLAAGREEVENQRSYHYTGMFETLRDTPEMILRNPGHMAPSHADLDLVDDPIDYLGGALRYTQPSDPAVKALRSVLAYSELLAQQHGRLRDTNEGVRMQTQHWASTWSVLF